MEVDGSIIFCSRRLVIWSVINSILGGGSLYRCIPTIEGSLGLILYSIRCVNPNFGVSTIEKSRMSFKMLLLSGSDSCCNGLVNMVDHQPWYQHGNISNMVEVSLGCSCCYYYLS